MKYIFISDLHLSENDPCLTQGFFSLLKYYQPQSVKLYILGDWFNHWIGDDQKSDWLDKIIEQLQQFTNAGNQIYFLKGNRDFALGEKFLNKFQGQLLNDVDHLNIKHLKIRLEHGDLLCTDDIQYQRFRKIIRHPIILNLLLALPIRYRKKLADGFRKQSQQANSKKNWDIMDVNPNATQNALRDIDIIIHGHTHRPQIHIYPTNQQRIVLGDWRANHQLGEAMILEIDEQANLNFYKWTFKSDENNKLF